MMVSNWVIYGAAELFALLLGVCAFLLYHTRSTRNLLKKVQEKLQQVVTELKESKKANKALKKSLAEKTTDYSELVDEQLNFTRTHHQTLNPTQDITLDLGNEEVPERQLASLRHAFLITEKEAALSGDGNNKPNWNVINTKFSHLLNFFRTTPSQNANDNPVNDDEKEELRAALADAEQRIENLQHFKTLFFELEDKWEEAQKNAQTCHDQLSGFKVEGDQTAFNGLLNQYQKAYAEFGADLSSDSQLSGNSGNSSERVTTLTQVVEKEKKVYLQSDELDRLKSVAANQHQLINELQQRLIHANSSEEKVAMINELKDQLDQQARYVKESETCIELMENELDQAHYRINELEAELGVAEQRTQQNIVAIKEAKKFQEERYHLDKQISNLQAENQQLEMQLESAMSSPDVASDSGVKRELNDLKEQYTELESKYLALRMKNR